MMKKWFWLLIFFMNSSVFAQEVSVSGTAGSGTSLGTVASNLTDTSNFFTETLNAIFYVIGIAFVVASIMRYRDHRQNPSQTPISRVIIIFLAGLAIGFFPLMIKYLGDTTAYLSR